jgi:hypothetical protein
LAEEAIDELLPNYKEREPSAKDSLDVFINHRWVSICLMGNFIVEKVAHVGGVIRALTLAFVGNFPRGHFEQEWYRYKTTPSLLRVPS